MRFVRKCCLCSGSGTALAVALIAQPAAQPTATPPPPPQMRLIVSFPSNVRIDLMPPLKNNGVIVVKAKLTLVNESKNDVMLTQTNDCLTHTWTVTESSGHFDQDGSVCNMLYKPISRKITARGKITAREDVTLNGPNYRDGVRYVLHYRFWGVSGDASFIARVAR